MIHFAKKPDPTMQLAITALSNNHPRFLAEFLPALRDCKCTLLEIRSSRLAESTAAYLLIQGNWNQIAKIENMLDALQKRMEVKIHTLRPDHNGRESNHVPYSLETISLDRENVIESITAFLFDRNIDIEEITGSSYQAPYIQTSVFSAKFILLIPPEIRLLSLREEFLDFCDHLNIDAILEPIKR
jgi:glycine cleavage system transcriptional repressor